MKTSISKQALKNPTVSRIFIPDMYFPLFLFERLRTCRHLFNPANARHDRFHTEETEFLVIGFFHDLPISLGNGVFPDRNGAVYSILDQIKGEVAAQNIHYRTQLLLLIQELVILLDRNANGAKRQKGEDWLSFVLNYMDIHYYEEIDIDTLSQITNYSYHHFRHKFKAATGVSPSRYIQLKRIEAAKEKLAMTNQSLSEIISECGFSNSSQFCQIFKKYVGESPLSYRQKNNKLRDSLLKSF